jgi:hypothetical protein
VSDGVITARPSPLCLCGVASFPSLTGILKERGPRLSGSSIFTLPPYAMDEELQSFALLPPIIGG